MSESSYRENTASPQVVQKTTTPAHAGLRGQATLPDGRRTDRSKDIFRVDLHHRGVASVVESTAVANDSPGGTAFLLDGLPWWICNFDGAGYDNPIQSVVNVTRRYQVPHLPAPRRLYI